MRAETEALIDRMFAATGEGELAAVLEEANTYALAPDTPEEDSFRVSQATELVAMRLEAVRM